MAVSTENSEPEKAALELMKNWDFTLRKEGPEALIFEKWYYLTGVNLVKDQLDSLLLAGFVGNKTFFENFMENMRVKPDAEWADDVTTTDVKETFGDIIGLSFQQTVKELSAKFGSDPKAWKWGDSHTITLAHPLASVKILDKIFNLNRGPYPVGGSFHTVCPYENPLDKNSEVSHGASERHIFDTGNWDRSLTVIPTGTSGIPSSKYYCDQTDLYLNNKYHSDYVSREKVEGKTVYRMKFTP